VVRIRSESKKYNLALIYFYPILLYFLLKKIEVFDDK